MPWPKGRLKTPEHCAKLSAALKGTGRPESVRKALSAFRKALYADPAERAKLGAHLRKVYAERGRRRRLEHEQARRQQIAAWVGRP